MNIDFMSPGAIEQYVATLTGQCIQIKDQEDSLTTEISASKGRELLQPAVNEVLERLQKAEHQRSVGVFGGLLSALANDVLPNSSKPIVLDLYTAHGAPALDIDIQANDKHKEEITSGALKNILSVGLRLIAIARTKQRRFMVLDEPDHWIKPDNVPQFVSVLDKIIKDLGFQILMISHHPKEYFEQTAKCVLLERSDDGSLFVGGDRSITPHTGLQAIRLVNFESHTDTRIPLHEGMTILTGENNLGKSSVVRAMKALCNGETHNDRVIKHLPKEEAFCRAEILLENGQWCGWRRARKLNQTMRHKNRFYLRSDEIDDGTTFLAAEDTSDGLPDFIQTALNIKQNDKWDIHIAAQEESVFLINKTTKASERAKILALGNEAKVLHDMIELNRLQSRQDKEIIRNGEKKLSLLSADRARFESTIQTIRPEIDRLNKDLSNINTKTEHEKAIFHSLSTMRASVLNYEKAMIGSSLMTLLPAPISIKPLDEISQSINELKWSETWANINVSEADIPSIPALNDVSEINGYISKIKSIKLNDFDSPEIPDELFEIKTDELNTIIETTLSVEKLVSEFDGMISDVEAQLSSVEKMISTEWSHHDTCPLCLQNISH